ncbi:hypothetical protein [Nocardia sp. NPDC058666]|uniref:hypothetical protein n=1 Tax=unclassified Nocardia TaxID=2637762 RepID=UPI0036504C5B
MFGEVVATMLVVAVGLVHLVPGVVALAPRRAAVVYGTKVRDRDLELLLRHRAVLLTLVGVGLIVGAFVSSTRAVTMTAGVLSTGSFVALSVAVGWGNLNSRTRRVAQVDVAALAALAVAAGLFVVV